MTPFIPTIDEFSAYSVRRTVTPGSVSHCAPPCGVNIIKIGPLSSCPTDAEALEYSSGAPVWVHHGSNGAWYVFYEAAK